MNIMETQSTKKRFTSSIEQRKLHKPTKNIYLLLSLTPLILVVAGSVLTVVGNTGTASFKNYKIAGPVVIAAGGLLLLFITVWYSCQDQLVDENKLDCTEESVNSRGRRYDQDFYGGGSNDQLGPIHQFEIKIPSKSSEREIVPPSYEEALCY